MTLDKQMDTSRIRLLVKHAIKYYLVGVTGVLLNLGILYSLTEFAHLWYMISAVIAALVTIISNFTLDKIWTFRDAVLKQKTIIVFVKFAGVCMLGTGIYLGLIYTFVEMMSVYYMLAAVVSIGIAGTINFMLNRRWSFGIKF